MSRMIFAALGDKSCDIPYFNRAEREGEEFGADFTHSRLLSEHGHDMATFPSAWDEGYLSTDATGVRSLSSLSAF